MAWVNEENVLEPLPSEVVISEPIWVAVPKLSVELYHNWYLVISVALLLVVVNATLLRVALAVVTAVVNLYTGCLVALVAKSAAATAGLAEERVIEGVDDPIVCVPPAFVDPVKEVELVSPILLVVTALTPNVLPRLVIEDAISIVMKKYPVLLLATICLVKVEKVFEPATPGVAIVDNNVAVPELKVLDD